MKRLFLLVGILPAVLFWSCHKGRHNPEACNGDTRREVKLLLDADASRIDTNVISTTIDSLSALDVPETDKKTSRQPQEFHVYKIRATVEAVKRERDGDYHLRLTDGDSYLITESANPECGYAQRSAWLPQFQRVRQFIDDHLLEGKEVEVTGVAFIDIDHHYKRKQAANNIELHPILAISF